MCRPIFPYELGDPDFSWLLATFQESHPNYFMVDSSCLPLVLVETGRGAPAETSESEFIPDDQPEKEAREK